MTDIFATLGPACNSSGILKDMLGAGMTGLRLNLNHGRLSDAMPLLLGAREAARFSGKELKLLADLQGRSLRIGALPAPITLREGETVVLGEGGIPIPAWLLAPGTAPAEFHLSDGRIRLATLEKRESAYLCRVIAGGVLESRKGMTVTGAESNMPILTEQDRDALAHLREAGVHAVMVPFVTDAGLLRSVRKALDEADCPEVGLWAKLENRAGLETLSEWLPLADMCVIARGDLGNSFPLTAIPALQKQAAETCLTAGKPFLVATGLLRSLMYEEQPSRADISDIYNAVLDGASGLMLTDETARGARPALSVRYLALTAQTAEQDAKKHVFA